LKSTLNNFINLIHNYSFSNDKIVLMDSIEQGFKLRLDQILNNARVQYLEEIGYYKKDIILDIISMLKQSSKIQGIL